MRAILALCLAAILTAGSAADASGGGKAEKKSDHGAKSEQGASGKDEKDGKPKDGLFGNADNIVPLPAIIAPVVVRGNLDSHLYMFLAAETASADEAKKLKDKLPYVLDDLILTVYAPATEVPKANAEPNYAALVERVRTSINRIMGREIVTKVEIGKIDTAPY